MKQRNKNSYLCQLVTLWGSIVLSSMCVSAFAVDLPPATSDYVKDTQTTYNQDSTTDAFNLVKTVACFVKNSKPELKAGQGKYVAWVEKSKCDDQNQTTTSGDMTPKYQKATIESGSDASGNLIARIWLLNLSNKNNQWVTKNIFAIVNISSGVNVAPPLGVWKMDYCSAPDALFDCKESWGHAEVTATQIKVWQKGYWDDGVTYQVNQGVIAYDLVGGSIDSGRGIVNVIQGGPQVGPTEKNYFSRFAFKPNFYLSHVNDATTNNADKDICFDRRVANGYSNTWETWLYNNDATVTTGNKAFGNKTPLNGGFSIKKVANDESTRGWASYWGLWFPPDVTPPANGDALYGGPQNQNNTYTYKKVAGVLNKYSISKSNISVLTGVPININLVKKKVTSAQSTDTTWVNVRMHWNGSQFVVDAVNGDNQNMGNWKASFTTSELIQANSSDGNWFNPNIYAWQDGSPVSYQLILADGNANSAQNIVAASSNSAPGCTWNNNVSTCILKLRDPSSQNPPIAISRSQTRVLPGTADALALDKSKVKLVCTGSCIGTTGAYVETTNPWGSVLKDSPVKYAYNAATGEMSLDSGKSQTGAPRTDVTTGVIVAPTDSGRNTQALIPDDAANAANLAALQCSNNLQYCGWTADEKISGYYYGFQVGPNTWDNTSFLMNGSTPVNFDPPMNLSYTVHQTGSPEDGKTVNFQYQGNGNLNLPGHCLQRSNASKTLDCGSGSWDDKFYANDFAVPPWSGTLNDIANPSQTQIDQATVKDANNGSVSFLVKWLRRGVLFNAVDVTNNINGSQCNGLTPPSATSLTLPTVADWKNPANPISSNYIGPWIDPSGPPWIMDGVLQ